MRLGYDAGLYLYLFKHNNLPEWVISSFSPGIAILAKGILSITRISPEQLLSPFLLFFSFLTLLSVYLFARRVFGKTTALWASFIFFCSAIQTRAAWYYYLNNIAALGFLFLAYFFLLGNSYWAIPFSILVAYFHRPTFIFLMVSLVLGFIVHKTKRKYYFIVSAVTVAAAALYYLPTFNITVLPLIDPVLKWFVPPALGGHLGEASGTFLEPWQALLLALPYLPFAVYGLAKTKQKKNLIIILGPLALSFIVVLFRLFFFRRIIIFLDIFVIPFAGYGVSLLIKRRLFAFLYAVFLLVFISVFIAKTSQPLIYPDEFKEIKMLSKITEPEAFVLVTDEMYMPWVYGWSDRKVIAPGFGENDRFWSADEWNKFWLDGNPETTRALLAKIPKPLYIFYGDQQARLAVDFNTPCFEKVNWRTFKFICD